MFGKLAESWNTAMAQGGGRGASGDEAERRLEQLREQDQVRRAMAESKKGRGAVPAGELISKPLPLSALSDEYAQGTRADLYRAKRHHLEGQYATIRRVRGDGNCFYRGFHVSWMERLLQLPRVEQSRVWLRLVPQAIQEYEDSLPDGPLRGELDKLGKEFADRTREMCDAVLVSGADAAGAVDVEVALHRAVSDPKAMEKSLRWLRLLISACMRKNSGEYEAFCVADGTRSFDAFLETEVETMGVEADQMQIMALTQALQLRVRVEYLDDTNAPWSTRGGVHRFEVCGPATRWGPAAAAEAREVAAAAGEAGNGMPPSPLQMPRAPLVACLLFRPGHYDVLSPRNWEDSMLSGAFGGVSRGRHLAPPLPPADVGRQCGGCSGPMQGCVLCATPLCVVSSCPQRLQLAEARASWAARKKKQLPEGWEERTEPKLGRKFYINHNDKTTSWELPAVEAPPKLHAQSEAALAKASTVLFHMPGEFGEALRLGGICDDCVAKLGVASLIDVAAEAAGSSQSHAAAGGGGGAAEAAAQQPVQPPAQPPVQPPAQPPTEVARAKMTALVENAEQVTQKIAMDPQTDILRYFKIADTLREQGEQRLKEDNHEDAYKLLLRLTSFFLERLPQHPNFKSAGEATTQRVALKEACRKALEDMGRLKPLLLATYTREAEEVAKAAAESAARNAAAASAANAAETARQEEEARRLAIDYDVLLRCPRATGPGGCGFLGFGTACKEHAVTCAAEAVQCPFAFAGCSVLAARAELHAHIGACPHALMGCKSCGEPVKRSEQAAHEQGCAGRLTACEWCAEQVPRNQMDLHRASACPGRNVSCQRCGATHVARDSDAHAQVCLATEVQCLWSCGEIVLRGGMATHQATCPGAWLRCPGAGCGERMRRRYAQEHWSRCPAMPEMCPEPECKKLVARRDMANHLKDQCEAVRRRKMFNCSLCGTEEDIDGCFSSDCVELEGTNHRFCFECIVGHVRNTITGMSDATRDQVTCPGRYDPETYEHTPCSCEISPHQVQGLQRPRPGADGQMFQLEAELNEKYSNILMLQFSRQQPGFKECPRSCGYGLDFGHQEPTYLTCHKCEISEDNAPFQRAAVGGNLTFCLAEGCRAPHDPRKISCQEYRRQMAEQRDGGGDQAMLPLIRAGIFKYCPGVGCPGEDGRGVLIQKAAGCQHMDCVAPPHGCGQKFCWHCLANHQTIVANDTSYHRRECLLWTPPGEDASQEPPRPETTCTRTKNADAMDAETLRWDAETQTHCACRHECPCDSKMEIVDRCQCGAADAAVKLKDALERAAPIDDDGTPPKLPCEPSACICGHSVVRCSTCKVSFCRICNRAPHPGEPCLENQKSACASESEQMRRLQPAAAAGAEAAAPGAAAAAAPAPGAAGPSAAAAPSNGLVRVPRRVLQSDAAPGGFFGLMGLGPLGQ